jgi:hypothetical protein
MYINDVLIDSLPVYPSADNKVHVNQFKQQLLQKHSERLSSEEQAPVFTLEGVPSRANQKFTSLSDTYDLLKGDDPLFPPSKKHKE